MISRRRFLALLTSFSTVFIAPLPVHGKTSEVTALEENSDLYLYKGWVLRADDPIDNEIGL